MNTHIQTKLVAVLNHALIPLKEQGESFQHLISKIGDARFVLIGEASHGTQEFYQARIKITQQLIKEHGFMAVAIEGDWPDAYKVHRYLHGEGSKKDPIQALDKFQRFPTWMWRNTTIPPFISWLREHNDALDPKQKIGFYGLDLYSLNSSMHAVIDFLMQINPEAAEQAKKRYACFDHTGTDPQLYGYLIKKGVKKSCLNEAVAELVELQHQEFKYTQDGATQDDYFFATQNARLVKNAEHYYRTMLDGYVPSWNIRDQHMAETLNVLADHLEQRFDKPAKIIVWAHNSHVGDARATEMGSRGELNLGQLVREQHNGHTYSIGFSTYDGYVTAASNWDEPAEQKQVIPAFPGSYEELFHEADSKHFLLDLEDSPKLEYFFKVPRLQRAIGVIYRPDTERFSHYFFTYLPYQFDSIIHFDKTNALEPLDT